MGDRVSCGAAVVDEEIDRLPNRLRRAVVLCYLEGRTAEQAAVILGCPRGTVLSRLSTARERLRGRLTRRGFALPASGFSILIFASESPASLVPAAVRAALSGASPLLTGLVQGVFHAMFITKVKVATAVVLGIGLAGTGVGWIIVPGSGPTFVQAEEPRVSSNQATQKLPSEEEKRIFDANLHRTYALILEAKVTVAKQLEQAEQAHHEFRLKNPILFRSGANPRARLDLIEAKQIDLRLKAVELSHAWSF
jgi:hypothetical protein